MLRRLTALSAALALACTACDGGAPTDRADAQGHGGFAGEDDDCATDGAWTERMVIVPLGETLFFAGDDYLASFDDGRDCPIAVRPPAGAVADAIDGRLTPDVPGPWVLERAGERITVDVQDDFLDADTFQNYNYTPVDALTLVDDDTLLVVSPPSNAVHRVVLTADGATPGDLIPTGAWPTSVASWPGSGYALVAQTGRDSIGFLDLAAGRVVDAIRVGDEPAGIRVQGDVAYVTLSGEDRVARVDLQARRVLDTLEVGRDPRSMALSPDGGTLYVASLISYNAHRSGPSGPPTEAALKRDIAIIDTADFSLRGFVPEVGTIIRGLHASDGGLIAAVSHSRNDRSEIDADNEPHTHGLARVDLTTDPPTVTHVPLGESSPAASPFTLMAVGDRLLVTLSASRAVLVLDRETLAEEARLPTGHDPRGLALAHDRVWTTAWLDNRLEGLTLPPVDAEPVIVPVGDDPTPPDVKAGQRIFNDASFSEHGQFSCNNCHIDGLTDGLVWDLLVDGEVNTLAFRNVAGTDPFLWGGELPTLFDFSREVLRLVGGDATGQQMEQLTLYMQSITAPPNPFTRPGGRLTDEALRGRALFDTPVDEGGAACVGCHGGPLFTSRAIVPGKTDDIDTDVPGLIGVYDTAPYGRRGDWVTLEGMLDRALEYTGADLDAADHAALMAYLRQIPGDGMWLNGTRPLSGADHVWRETPIELTFSHRLAAEQADRFSITRGDGAPVDGAWTVRGRVARFAPAAPLRDETVYRIAARAPLAGALGQRLRAPIHIEWRTGSDPQTDISGRYEAQLMLVDAGIGQSRPLVQMAALQSSGGDVTGVIDGYDDVIDLSHVEGMVSGQRVVFEPFLLVTTLGDFLIEQAYMDTTDEDGDGYADTGAGRFRSLGRDIEWTARRLAAPPE